MSETTIYSFGGDEKVRRKKRVHKYGMEESEFLIYVHDVRGWFGLAWFTFSSGSTI